MINWILHKITKKEMLMPKLCKQKIQIERLKTIISEWKSEKKCLEIEMLKNENQKPENQKMKIKLDNRNRKSENKKSKTKIKKFFLKTNDPLERTQRKRKSSMKIELPLRRGFDAFFSSLLKNSISWRNRLAITRERELLDHFVARAKT